MRTDWFPSGRLGRQISTAFVALAATLSLALGLALASALTYVEQSILDDTLRMELAHYRYQVQTARALGAFNSRTTIIHVAPLDSTESIPAHLRELSAGNHDIKYKGRDYRVLVDELDGVRYTVQYDDTNIHRREQEFLNWVWFSAIAALFLCVLFGLWIGHRLSRPTHELAQQIRALGEQPSDSLALSQYKNDEIGLIARRLQWHHEQLSNLLVREKEFAGNVSHELRTPITTISLAAEVLATNANLDDKDRERLQRISRATGEMFELVETFLVLAKLEQIENDQHSYCELRPIVDDVIAQQRVWLGDKPVAVTVDDQHPVLIAAPARVVSVLVANLARNAFRYTMKGSITLTLGENKVLVADTGVGVDSNIAPHLFDRHVRGKTGDRDGAGLGLSIVKRICERYHWTVSVDSIEGEGSCFTIDFQSAAAQQP